MISADALVLLDTGAIPKSCDSFSCQMLEFPGYLAIFGFVFFRVQLGDSFGAAFGAASRVAFQRHC